MKIYQIIGGLSDYYIATFIYENSIHNRSNIRNRKSSSKRLAGENYRLILCGRRKEVLEELAGELALKTDVYTLTFDVRNYEEVQNAITSLPAEWKAVDILINNAGNAHGLEPLTEGKVSDWDMMMDGNVKGLLYVSKCIIPR